MKNIIAVVMFVIICIFLFENNSQAKTVNVLEQQGCCSSHGGVCGCFGGHLQCCDGSTSRSCGC
jgi:hypothetical protein